MNGRGESSLRATHALCMVQLYIVHFTFANVEGLTALDWACLQVVSTNTQL